MKPSIVEVESLLDNLVRPLLYLHGGGVEVNAIDDAGGLHLRFTGACRGCFLRPMTLAATLAPALIRLDGLTGIEIEGMVAPPEAFRFCGSRFTTLEPS